MCDYADDVMLISRNEKNLRQMIVELENKGKMLGLEVNER